MNKTFKNLNKKQTKSLKKQNKKKNLKKKNNNKSKINNRKKSFKGGQILPTTCSDFSTTPCKNDFGCRQPFWSPKCR